MKLVIAGNYRQFKDYLRENKLSELDARFVDRIEQVQGMRGSEIVTYGTWTDNPLSEHISAVRALVAK